MKNKLKFLDRFPLGTTTVSSGLLINGVSAYAFISIASRDLGPEIYTPIGMLWAISFLLGPGIFQPLEQETARTIASRSGLGVIPVVRSALIVGGSAALLIVSIAIIMESWITNNIFGGESSLLISAILVVVGLGLAHLVKGVLAGLGRFRGYARYIVGEGLGRLTATGLLAIFASGEVWIYGVAIGISPFLGIFFALIDQKNLKVPGSPIRLTEISKTLSVMLIASLSTALVLNVSPLAIEVLAESGQEEEPGKFLNALLLARIPLFFFQAVQAALLPRLSHLATSKMYEKFKDELLKLIFSILVFGVFFIFLAAIAGQWATRFAFGEEYEILRQDMVLLAVSSVILMIALSLTQGLLAYHLQGLSAAAWACGVILFPFVLMLGNDLFLKVEVALIVSATCTSLLLGIFLNWRLMKRVC